MDLQYPFNQGSGAGNGLLGIAIDITQTVARFLGATLQVSEFTYEARKNNIFFNSLI